MSLLKRALAAMAICASLPAQAGLQVVIVQGLGGQPAYEEEFAMQANALRTAASTLTQQVQLVAGEQATRLRVQALFSALAASQRADDRLAVYLVGHGSFDGEEYKFNVSGADITGRDLRDMLNALPAKDQLVVATGSSSGALHDLLKSDTRIVVTATRSGSERNATRFGTEFVAALQDQVGDTDKNGTISIQEAFNFAERGIKTHYELDVRLATEHAVLRGERASLFAIARSGAADAVGAAVDADGAPPDPQRARITDALDALRLRKDSLPAAEYDSQLEALLLELAELDAVPRTSSGTSP